MTVLNDDLRAAIRAQLTARPAPSTNQRQRRIGTGLWHKPFSSTALGVGVKQIEKARAHLRSHGVTADFDRNGDCIITSDKQYRDVAKAVGIYDCRDGYEVKDNDGNPILTGRRPAEQWENFKKTFSEEADW